MGLSTSASISLGMDLVAGRKRVPSPAAGKTALRTFLFMRVLVLSGLKCVQLRYCGKDQPKYDAEIVVQSVGELSPSIACRTILMGAPPCRMKSSWNRCREKAVPSFF